jgi:hypothetical protein
MSGPRFTKWTPVPTIFQRSLESSMTMLFKLRPAMSVLGKDWTDMDPAYWTPKPAAPAKK